MTSIKQYCRCPTYDCYCIFNDGFPQRRSSQITGSMFPLCDGILSDDIHRERFCKPYHDAIKSIGGDLEIQYGRLQWLSKFLKRLSDEEHFSHSEERGIQLLEYIYPSIRDCLGTENRGEFILEGIEFARLVSSAWYVVKRMENSLAEYTINRRVRKWSKGDLIDTFLEFMDNFLDKREEGWLKMAINTERTLSDMTQRGNFTIDLGEVPYVFRNARPSGIELIARLRGITKVMVDCIPDYYDNLTRGLNQIAKQPNKT